MSTTLILKILEEFQQFEKSPNFSAVSSVDDFRQWLNRRYYESQEPDFIPDLTGMAVHETENALAKQIILLSRFTRQMLRRGLADFPELCNEEFTYLYRLMDEPMLSKMQLVERNAHEKARGMDIIRRLVKYGLLEEVEDGQDRRVTRLRCTENGVKAFEDSVQKVSTISRVLSAKISEDEKQTLLSILQKLNEFHFTVYQSYREASVEEINALI